jgi:3-deoxy-7-phosphoheptulonate synthase
MNNKTIQWKFSREFNNETRTIDLGGFHIGGNTNNTVMIAGPCSIESKEQIEQVAEMLVKNNIKVLRAGAFKPRTNPYSFMGMGEEGLKLLREVGDKYNLKVITEIRDSTQAQMVVEYTDIIQTGAKAMWDYGMLEIVGKSNKPVMIKRAFGARVQEFAQIAEFVLNHGNDNVILCERGIRSFETATRFTLDLCGVAWLKEKTNLPIILDPSHAMGYAYGIPDLTRACVAMGVDGLIIETHPNPLVAKSDAEQQLNLNEFETMFKSLKPIASAIGKNII